MTPEWVQAVAAVLTLLAAVAALVIAQKAPRLAARYAEDYRKETAAADELRSLQTNVFRALMKGRKEILAQDTRAAINLVEVAFADVPKVRNARRMFTKAANASPFDAVVFLQAFTDLVQEVSVAVGLGDKIDRFDIESGYYPEVLSKIDAAALAEAEQKLAQNASGASSVVNR